MTMDYERKPRTVDHVVVVFSLRETAVDFWSLFKKGQKAPIFSATKDKQQHHQQHLHLPWGYLHPLSCPLVRSSHLWRHLAGPITCLQATIGTFSIHFQVLVSSIFVHFVPRNFEGKDERILTHVFQMGWNHPDFHEGFTLDTDCGGQDPKYCWLK